MFIGNQAEAQDPEIRLLLNLRTEVREVEIELMRNCPSFIMVGGKKAKAWYRGQEWNCQHCLKSFKKCPSGGDRNKCKSEGNTVLKFKDMWAKALGDTQTRLRMASSEEYEVDTLKIDGVPTSGVAEDIVRWLKENGSIYVKYPSKRS